MPPHIKQRKDRGSKWYLVDGSRTKSTGTTKKGLAQHLLEQYIKGKYGLRPTPTVKEYFDSWIAGKIEPLFRRSLVRNYKQHFRAYILPRFKDRRLLAIGTAELAAFMVELLRRGLKVKTARNIVDGSFRALYRDARAEFEELKGKDPFIDLHWPANRRAKPDPFTAQERDRIVAYWAEKDFFYFPWGLRYSIRGCDCLRPQRSPGVTWI